MNTHTKGPWTVESRTWRDHHSFVIASDNIGDICRLYTFVGPAGTQEANARLIASAPELLARLEDAAFQLERLTGENLETYARTFAALARNAIAKAKGEM